MVKVLAFSFLINNPDRSLPVTNAVRAPFLTSIPISVGRVCTRNGLERVILCYFLLLCEYKVFPGLGEFCIKHFYSKNPVFCCLFVYWLLKGVIPFLCLTHNQTGNALWYFSPELQKKGKIFLQFVPREKNSIFFPNKGINNTVFRMLFCDDTFFTENLLTIFLPWICRVNFDQIPFGKSFGNMYWMVEVRCGGGVYFACSYLPGSVQPRIHWLTLRINVCRRQILTSIFIPQ